MTERKYDYDFYLSSSTKLKGFLDKYKNRHSTYRSYKLHLVRYFQSKKIKDIDGYVKDTRLMDKEEKIKYLDNIESDLTNYWIAINNELVGKTPYVWLSAIKMFLIHCKTFELDNVYRDLQKNGHGNYAVTNTQTPTKEEIKKIFSYSDPESKALFMFQLTSGQRINQVIETTFDNIDMEHDCPRIFYPKAKQKYVVKTRITPEAKQMLKDYLEQRKKFIKIRTKRGELHRVKELDMNRIFPMTVGTANVIWTTMVRNAGLYELDPNSNKPVFGTHCLRRYFLSHFPDRDFGDYFSGHITARNREYRQYSDAQLDKIYEKYLDELNIFETQSDLSGVHSELKEKDEEMVELKKEMATMRNQMNILMAGKLIEMDKKKG